jgi:hypothetical protein
MRRQTQHSGATIVSVDASQSRIPVMTLAFPNPSRNFDEARHGVRFSGHDGMFEILFFVEAAVLAERQPRTPQSEEQCLSAFDAKIASIHDVARKMYSGHRRHSNILTTADFR